jgi:hypothetical protein
MQAVDQLGQGAIQGRDHPVGQMIRRAQDEMAGAEVEIFRIGAGEMGWFIAFRTSRADAA